MSIKVVPSTSTHTLSKWWSSKNSTLPDQQWTEAFWPTMPNQKTMEPVCSSVSSDASLRFSAFACALACVPCVAHAGDNWSRTDSNVLATLRANNLAVSVKGRMSAALKSCSTSVVQAVNKWMAMSFSLVNRSISDDASIGDDWREGRDTLHSMGLFTERRTKTGVS